MEKEKILERIRERFEFIDLQDWGSFYTRQVYPLLKKEEGDEWEEYRGFYIPPNVEKIIPARLRIYILLDGENIPYYMFYFSVISRQGQVIASNL